MLDRILYTFDMDTLIKTRWRDELYEAGATCSLIPLSRRSRKGANLMQGDYALNDESERQIYVTPTFPLLRGKVIFRIIRRY